jgi:hypothetical protein
VTRESSAADDFADINLKLRAWQQGDCALVDASGFLYRFQLGRPANAESRSVEDGSDVVEVETPGLVVVTQTCDIQRTVQDRPFVEVAALVDRSSGMDIEEIKKGMRPRFAYVPGVAAKTLVADLDQIMTIEKPLLGSWPHVDGCRSDSERREFAKSIARKFSRFAFPDDFVALVANLIDRIRRKHGKTESDEGKALRALSEIRVAASPHWNVGSVELMFYFIRREDQIDFGEKSWAHWCAKWLDLIGTAGRYTSVDGVVQPLSRLRADEYVASDQLDLEHLSPPSSLRI